jgi:hypothetical protein
MTSALKATEELLTHGNKSNQKLNHSLHTDEAVAHSMQLLKKDALCCRLNVNHQ